MKKDLFLTLDLQMNLLMITEDLDTAEDIAADILVTISYLEPKYQKKLKPLQDSLENFLGITHFDVCN